MGQEIWYCARDIGVCDVEIIEVGEISDGRGDCAEEVCVNEVKIIQVGKVAYGGGNRVGFGEVKVGEVEDVDAACLVVAVGDTSDTFPNGVAIVSGWEP